MAEGERLIAREEQMNSDLECAGHDTKLAIETLAICRRKHAVHAAHHNLLKVPNSILQRWRVWLELNLSVMCRPKMRFANLNAKNRIANLGTGKPAKRRLAYLESGKANSGHKSPTKTA